MGEGNKLERKEKMGVGCGVMILNKEGKVLLGLRNSDPEKADSALHGEGSWTMPGGKLEFGETLIDTAIREVEEETGLIVKGGLELVSLNDDIMPGVHFVTAGFVCTEFSGEPEVKEPDEIVRWEWFDLNDLPTPMYSASLPILENYINGTLMSE